MIVFSVILSRFKTFIGGGLATEGSILGNFSGSCFADSKEVVVTAGQLILELRAV